MYKGKYTYNAQMEKGKAYRTRQGQGSKAFGLDDRSTVTISDGTRYPSNILKFDSVPNGKRHHTSEKPVKLLEYLIKSFSNEGDLVLDITAGSATTAVAAVNTGRKFIAIEKNFEFCEVAAKRIDKAYENIPEPLANLFDLMKV